MYREIVIKEKLSWFTNLLFLFCEVLSIDSQTNVMDHNTSNDIIDSQLNSKDNDDNDDDDDDDDDD